MLQLNNTTLFQGTLLLMPDQDGVECLLVIVKGTFSILDSVSPAATQVPITFADNYWGDPSQTSIKTPSDVSLSKPYTDVLLMGTAYAGGDKLVTALDVQMCVGPLTKTVRVIGDRTWQPTEDSPSPPQAFRTMPLQWEQAFGGTDTIEGNPPRLYAEERNPTGKGFHMTRGRKSQEPVALPNLEDPNDLITSFYHIPNPASFAPVCPHWQPRRSFAGTYDEKWKTKRAPYLPEDFDSYFFQLAPPDQVVEGYLSGGEPVRILGATPSGELSFTLPKYQVQLTYRLDTSRHSLMGNLDTVIIEPDELRVLLVWRSAFRCGKRGLRVREVEVAATHAR